MKKQFRKALFVAVLCILALSLFGCMLFGEPEKTDEEKMVKAFINDFIDEKYEKIQETYAFAENCQFDVQEQGVILNGFYEKYGEKSAISQVLRSEDATAESYYRELLMKKGKVWLNVTLNEEKQIVGFSITDAGAFEEKK